jgi:sensor c-di-GMP phosphodiesterase-like protein
MIQVGRERMQPARARSQQAITAYAQLERDVQSLDASMQAARDISASVVTMFQCARDVWLISKQFDALVAQYTIAGQSSVERLRLLVPTVSQQLNRLSDQVDSLLKQAATIDARTCSPEDLTHRGALLQFAREASQNIHRALMDLMAK